MLLRNSRNIAITVTPEANGHCVCKAMLTLEGQTNQTRSFHGQSPNHAIAIALEDLAREFRKEAEAEQNIDWDSVDRSASGKLTERRFHVVLHYERIAHEQSKFEAMHNTLEGNTVVENAEISIVQVDPGLPIEPWQGR